MLESCSMLKRHGKSSESAIKKDVFGFGFQIFCERCHKRSTFRPLWLTSSSLAPKPLDQRWAKCGSRATCGSPTFRLRLFISTPVPYSGPSFESYLTSCAKLTQIHERVIKSFRKIIPYCTVLTPCV